MDGFLVCIFRTVMVSWDWYHAAKKKPKKQDSSVHKTKGREKKSAARLQLRKWPNEYFCKLCYRNLETSMHLIIECLVTRIVWETISGWVQQPCLSLDKW